MLDLEHAFGRLSNLFDDFAIEHFFAGAEYWLNWVQRKTVIENVYGVTSVMPHEILGYIPNIARIISCMEMTGKQVHREARESI